MQNQHTNQIFKKTGFYRLPEIIGDKKTGAPGLIPISKSSWWAGVRDGRFPKSVKLSPRTTVWRVEDVNALIAEMGR